MWKNMWQYKQFIGGFFKQKNRPKCFFMFYLQCRNIYSGTNIIYMKFLEIFIDRQEFFVQFDCRIFGKLNENIFISAINVESDFCLL